MVTGAGSGIGLATALRIAREGGDVVAVDLDPERLAALSQAHPGPALATVVAGVAADAGIDAIATAVGTRLDGRVNNAGIIDGYAPLGETDDALWRQVMAVNLDGPFRLTRALLPLLLQAPAASVVNVDSEAALRGSACGTAYTTSKHALLGLTRSAAFFYGPKGVRFNAVAPGAVATNIGGPVRSEWAQARSMDIIRAVAPPQAAPEQLAAPICWLLSRDSDNVCGTVLAADGGWSAV